LNINIIQNYKADIAVEKQQSLLVSNSVGRNAFNEFIEKMFYHFIEKDTTKDPSEDGFERIHDLDFSTKTSDVNRFMQMFEVMVEVVHNFTTKNGKFSAGSCCLRDILTFVNSLYAKKELKSIPMYKEYLNSILDVFHVVFIKNKGFKDYVAGNTELSDAEAISFWYKGFFSFFGKGQDSKFIHRRDFLNKNKELFGSILELDDKRIFSLSQRQFKYVEQNKKCVGFNGDCSHTEGELSINELHADHILEYSQGGTTTIDNLQLLCPKCHNKKTGEFNSKKTEEILEPEFS
jgi:5-methylcytosine-specific restriction endonuclease McrA